MQFLAAIRGVGRYQWRVILLFVIAFNQGWNNLGIILFAPHIPFRCLDFNVSMDFNSTKSFSNTNAQCFIRSEDGNPEEKCQNFQYDHSQFSWTLTERFDLVCDRKYIISVMKSSTIGGMLVGSVVCGLIADKLGRKITICAMTLLLGGLALIGGFVTNVWVFIAARFLRGGAYLIFYVTLCAISAESVTKEQRFIPMLIDNIVIPLGPMILGALYYLTSNYVHYFIIDAINQLVTFSWTLLLVMESPKWLMTKNRPDEAKQILKKIAEINGTPVDNTLLNEDEPQVDSTGNIFDLFRTRLTRKRTLVLFSIWGATMFGFYSLAYNLGDFSDDVRLAMILSGVTEGLTFTASWLTQKFGRTGVLFVSLACAGLCCLGMGPFVHDTSFIALTTLALLGKQFFTWVIFVLYLFTPELYPTCIRATGLGACSMASRIVTIVSPQLLFLNEYWPPLTVVVIGSLTVLAAFLVPLLPDMTDVELAQTIEDGERLFPEHGYSLRRARARTARGANVADEKA